MTSLAVIESRELGPSDAGSEAWISFLGAQIKLTVWPGAGCVLCRDCGLLGGIFFFFLVEKTSQIHSEHVK